MEDLARAVRAGVPITEGEARLVLGLPADPLDEAKTLRFNDQDVLQYHLENGIVTIDEARARLKLPKLPNGEGAVTLRKTTVKAVGGGRASGEDDEDDDDDEGAGGENGRSAAGVMAGAVVGR